MKRTAEFVTPRHPDKLADRIADAILDAFMSEDPKARSAVEILAGHGKLHIIGEAKIDGKTQEEMRDIALKIARDFIKTEGLPQPEIDALIVKQSDEIAAGVDTGGAGDQGIMYGFATRETESTGEYLPLDYCLARNLCEFLYEKYPEDGKTQITLEDDKIAVIVASFANAKQQDLKEAIRRWLVEIKPQYQIEPSGLLEIYANPAGDWSQSGWESDAGLTGRKLAVDNYGGACPNGGGAYSGKDPSKTDRSGAYIARKIALTILKDAITEDEAGNIEKPGVVQTRLAYAIGKAEPVEASAIIEWKNGKTYVDLTTSELFRFDLTPNGIIKDLKLQEIKFEPTARWGAYGHPGELPWEGSRAE